MTDWVSNRQWPRRVRPHARRLIARTRCTHAGPACALGQGAANCAGDIGIRVQSRA
jgi:hypothetical protein